MLGTCDELVRRTQVGLAGDGKILHEGEEEMSLTNCPPS